MEHKHAEILRAIADGKEVEGFDGITKKWESADNLFNPLTNPELQWRIKPEKKVLQYRVALMKGCEHEELFTTTRETEKQAKILEKDELFCGWLTDWQEVEVK
jgi:hypothetical protein